MFQQLNVAALSGGFLEPLSHLFPQGAMSARCFVEVHPYYGGQVKGSPEKPYAAWQAREIRKTSGNVEEAET